MIYTKGNVVVEEINVGDVHYEYNYGLCLKSCVTKKPIKNKDGIWSWESEVIPSGKKINYMVNEKYSHYGPNIYDYPAYQKVYK